MKRLKEDLQEKGVLEKTVKNVYNHKKKKLKKGEERKNPLSMKKGKKTVGKNKNEPKLGKSRGARTRRAKTAANGEGGSSSKKTE